MQILLTNDDGIYAPGLAAMEQQLRKLAEDRGVHQRQCADHFGPLWLKVDPPQDGRAQQAGQRQQHDWQQPSCGHALPGTQADCRRPNDTRVNHPSAR